MTKVTLHYNLTRPLTADDWENIALLPSTFGMVKTQVSPAGNQLRVDYDASRLMKTDVEAVLGHHGIPVAVAHL